MSKRIRDLKPPVTKWRERVFRAAAWPFSALSDDQRFWLGAVVLCLVTTLLIQNPLWRGASEQAYKEGDIARESVISPADISVSDNDESERLRAEAREGVRPIFRYESNKAEQADQSFLSSWEQLQ